MTAVPEAAGHPAPGATGQPGARAEPRPPVPDPPGTDPAGPEPAGAPPGGADSAGTPAGTPPGGGSGRPDPRGRRRRRLLLAASAAWLLYVVMQLLLSGRWWVWAIPDLMPPPVFLAVPLLLLAAAPLARPARRWVVAAAVVALVLGTGLAGINLRALIGGGDGPAPAGALRVLSWNTGVWERGDDRARFFGFLKAQRADVYLLQEYEPIQNGGGEADDLDRLHREFPGYEIVSRGELITLSRVPVIGVRALPAEPPAGSDWETVFSRVKSLRTDLRVGASTLSVYNVHIPIQIGLGRSAFSTATRDRFDDRRAQYRALAADVAGNPNPLLVSGDFNTSPSMGELRTLRGRLRDAIRADGAVYPTSWPAGVPVLPRLWRLDWVLTTPSIGVHEYTRLDPQGMSDHRATRLLISLRAAR